MQGYQFIVDHHPRAVPWWWFDAVVAWMGAMGFLLWLFGRRMIRPMFMFIGLAVGAGATVALLHGHMEQMPLLLSAIGGALIGAVAGYILWRVGIGVVIGSAEAVLGVVLVALAVGAGLPAYEAAAVKAREDVHATMNKAAVEDIHAEIAAGDVDKVVPGGEPFVRGCEPFIEASRDWWTGLSRGIQWVIATAGFAMATLGLILGMIFARRMSAVVTALIGITIMLPGLSRILELLPPDYASMVPHTVAAAAVVVVAGTVIGTLIQWTIFRVPTDK